MSGRATTAALAGDAARERRQMLALSVPAVTVIAAAVLVPTLWVLRLSLLGAAGALSLENYRVLASTGANVAVIVTTLKVSLIVTAVTVLIGYPLTYLLAQMPPRRATLCMVGVVLPYLTSVLVRTYAWMVLLGRRGVINSALIALGITSEPLPLMFNTTATVIGMVHVMLPLLVLPLYGAMRAIDPTYSRAAASLGAGPVVRFWKIYFPLSLPGLAAGGFLCFVTSLGFFITPTILGGGRVTMIAQQIATAMTTYSGFGMASALGIVLLLVTSALLAFAVRVLRIDLRRLQ
jgi:ABC-type spermidine/putrescine transport system permease subunit I